MDTDKHLDDLMDAYDEAFETLPVYKKKPVMKKMNDIDVLARDVAFEIILGGDRFDPDDLAAQLDGVSKGELNIFKDRVRYHAIDFAPPEHRPTDFVNRSIEGWTSGVRIGESEMIRQGFLDAAVRKERGRWFAFGDGEYRRCDTAVTDVMFSDRNSMYWPKRLAESMSPDPVDTIVVARRKADELLDRYGREVSLDGPWDTVDIESFGIQEAGSILSVRRNIDILAEKPEDHVYYVTYKPSFGQSSTLLSHMDDAELNRFIDLVGTEMLYREGKDLSLPEIPDYIVLPPRVVVTAPEPGPTGQMKFFAQGLFRGPDGDSMVSGRYVGEGVEHTKNFRLTDFSDKALSAIYEASSVALKARLQEMESRREGVVKKEAPAGRKKPDGSSVIF